MPGQAGPATSEWDDQQTVRRAVAAHLPDIHVTSVVPLGTGLDNISYEVNDNLVVRISKDSDSAERTARATRECQLLRVVAPASPVPVPQPLLAAAETGVLAYAKLRGRPLLSIREASRSALIPSVATALGELLRALHAIPADRVAGLVDIDDTPLTEWHRDAEEFYSVVAGHVPLRHRPAVDAFFQAAPPPEPHTSVFTHNDLGIEHVLVDPDNGEVTGIIDWSDAAIADPAYDFGLICRDLGPHALDLALARYDAPGPDRPGLHDRAVFYARCTLFEDVLYGVDTGQNAYVSKSLEAMTWLFP
ncbi:aminoglycoside phosphotransferase family protein [Micromonospora sp. NPDC047465]|uniref:phosphotransferase family protein n=1 Tax=Micromonospora sp. NPDC047465 TaxID=3154813 RepID=UPI0033F4D7D1